MFKTMKYELMKNRVPIFVMLGILAVLECLFLYENYFDFENVGISIVLLILIGGAVSFWILINGLVMFSRDFNNKSGYLVYMTPQPAVKIIAAKILTAFFTGVAFMVGYFLLGVLDVQLLISSGRHIAEEAGENTAMVFDSNMASLASFLDVLLSEKSFLTFGKAGFVMIVEVFFILTVAYLAISLGNTLLRGHKLQGLISFVLFIVLCAVFNYFGNMVLPDYDFSVMLGEDGVVVNSINLFSAAGIANLVYSIGLGVLAMFGSAYLIENKIDL